MNWLAIIFIISSGQVSMDTIPAKTKEACEQAVSAYGIEGDGSLLYRCIDIGKMVRGEK